MTERLARVLATLLPADGPWPLGAALAEIVGTDLAEVPGGAAALARVLEALPPDFAAGDEDALRLIEQGDSDAFGRVVAAAYLAYYTDPQVRVVLEHVTGYSARPPQPLGYELPPFDDALLERQRQRAPYWRDPEAPS